MRSKTLPNEPVRPKPKASRPAMPKEYRIKGARIGSGLRSWKEVVEQLAKARNYWIVTVRADGHPHAMPVWGIWNKGIFLFSTSRRSQKGRNLSRNPQLVVHLESGDNVVILEGAAEEVTDPVRLDAYVTAYGEKYQSEPDISDKKNVTYALRIQTAFSWLEKDFVGGATRWQF
jgi:PPOX class probable F420-dependent enzyme